LVSDGLPFIIQISSCGVTFSLKNHWVS